MSDTQLEELTLQIDKEFLTKNPQTETSGSTAVLGIVVPKGGKFSLQVVFLTTGNEKTTTIVL